MTEQPTLASLLTRLETATDRLEGLAMSSSSNPASVKRAIAKNADSLQATVPASVEAYDQIIDGSLKAYLESSEKIDELVKEQSQAVLRLFQLQRQFILVASQSKKPSFESSTFTELIEPTQQAINTICAYRNDNRGSPYFNHLSTISEGIPAFGWITVEPAPAPYVNEMKDSAQFYADRVLKEYKTKEPKHATWCSAFLTILDDLQTYVKAYHTTGLVWNPSGKDASEVAADLASPSNSGKRPRPPVPPRHDRAAASEGEKQPGRAALFSALNAGEGITSGLRKVNKSEMTHKNPELRSSNVVAGSAASAKKDVAAKKPSRTVLEGNKWIVEYHSGGEVVLDKVERNHAVYIYSCTNTTISIKGKVGAVAMDSCRKTGVVVDSIVSNFEVIGGHSVQVQIAGQVPIITVDKTDSLEIYLSPESMDVQLLTSMSTAVNILFTEVPNSDYVERAIPEQFMSRIVNGEVVTEPVVHSG